MKMSNENHIEQEDYIKQVKSYIQNMDEKEKNALRFGFTFMVSEMSAYLHQLIDKGEKINHDLLTSLERHYLRDLEPDRFENTLQLILK